jgi:CheY-like chemotaxis protein
MERVRLIHWNAAEAEERAAQLRTAGYEVEQAPLDAAGLRRLREKPPDAVVIDLNRSPSQGRDLAVNMRTYKATRHVPLVFAGGARKKVARIQELLPDAVYTTWDEIDDALERAIAHPPADPVVLDSVFAAYAGTPLPKKLGIREGSVVALVGAPEGFEATLGELPQGAVVRRGMSGQPDVTLWFTTSREELEREIARMGAFAAGGGLWIIWPKKASGVESDLSQTVVREVGLASGLVDFKVCAVDETWSGLRFTQRKAK